ncbi:hypothetical protein [Yunchengibacter salinarum]|uniref:hypothetical protein n=1 Tax=Yunchengibacter salinarum TaxID=3133399 RepID=UPI0035B62E83
MRRLAIHTALMLVVAAVFPPAGPGAFGQQAESETRRGCAGQDGFHAFDFWLGTWDVTSWQDNKPQGRNHIRALEDHCLIMEQWQGKGGSSGRSINYYNPVSDQWRQVWISAQAYAIDITGGWRDGAMRLTGSIWYYTSGRQRPFRGIWTPQADGSVRQRFEQKADDGGDWQVWFDGRYTPAKAAE